MTPRAWLTIAVSLLFGAVAGGQGQQPTFRSTTDIVSVDVLVRSGADSVGGLTASDFVLLDNGVPQHIDSIETTAVPVDVSLVVDVSGGDPAWFGTPRPPADIANQLTDLVHKTAAILRPEDRLRLLTIDTYATQVFPLQSVETLPKIERVATNGLSSLHDALASALLEAAEPNRRHLIIALTKAVYVDAPRGEPGQDDAIVDTISTIDAQTLSDLARRSDAVLHIVEGRSLVGDTQCHLEQPLKSGLGNGGLYMSPEAAAAFDAPNSALESCHVPKKRFWRPFNRQDLAMLKDLAPLTGGAFHGLDAASLNRDFVGTFKDVVEEFRHGYVLRYESQGVTREGWHEIQVSVPAKPSFKVQARRGYAIDATATTRDVARAVSSSPNRGASPPATVESLLVETYGRDPAAMQTMVRAAKDLPMLLRNVREASSPWPNNPRQEAVFVLDVVIAALKRNDVSTREEIKKLLVQYDTLVRQPLGADAFECNWYWGEIASLEGTVSPAFAMPFVSNALQRCPNEARFVLAGAVIADQQWPLGTTVTWPGEVAPTRPSETLVRDVTNRYEAAMQFPETAAEARVRAAWFAYRRGKFADARTLLDGFERVSSDRSVVYLGQLVRGHALRAQGEADMAAEAFRAALTAWPGAQAARVALMTVLLSHGDRAQAESLAETIQAAPDGEFDPWWTSWQGDNRVLPAIVARLREQAR